MASGSGEGPATGAAITGRKVVSQFGHAESRKMGRLRVARIGGLTWPPAEIPAVPAMAPAGRTPAGLRRHWMSWRPSMIAMRVARVFPLPPSAGRVPPPRPRDGFAGEFADPIARKTRLVLT
ncbi:hypothetical protein GCM10009530_21840 [Microbispora corallina]|uniref:Uncharacterized protein n=1 Tax=Microbispora corallina TaxID=83302 RepID=A0ABQ4G624_9ACTN|nr:hypothetical protein Mco01_55260 [Microbispora corallina]